jgi:hypothetical protein
MRLGSEELRCLQQRRRMHWMRTPLLIDLVPMQKERALGLQIRSRIPHLHWMLPTFHLKWTTLRNRSMSYSQRLRMCRLRMWLLLEHWQIMQAHLSRMSQIWEGYLQELPASLQAERRGLRNWGMCGVQWELLQEMFREIRFGWWGVQVQELFGLAEWPMHDLCEGLRAEEWTLRDCHYCHLCVSYFMIFLGLVILIVLFVIF